ncbi:SMP-30/gluconolactonase/LRE family protein [Sphingomonas crocodyli]|uniref:SMP-30/gluconolactonase/LRE family protein n=1 Tax=Sphingomonas crocodyli TaxID=1979270 RepID=A0A437M995_9SPHN|nr:SMP-30/gluconolactonase/LRE family protein [Sphingomonas crocodyli]RVT94193.1 SMP-30/gluconolactonase/LRE family protein [Sphingomonas crocodyli]
MDFEIVAEGLRFPEGPVALSDGGLLVVEIAGERLTRIMPDGSIRTVADLPGGPNGAAIGPDGKVYICNNGGFEWHEADGLLIPGHRAHDHRGGSIQRVDLDSGAVETLYTHCDGRPLQGPNDLAFDRHGGFWLTDHGTSDAEGRTWGAIHYAQADGSAISRVRSEVLSPNGIGLSPAGDVAYYADTQTQRLWALDLEGPGQARAPEAPWLPGRLIATLPGVQLLDSLKVEAGGRVCVGTMVHGGVTIFSPDGATEHVALPDIAITNLAFGGPDMRDVWLTGSATGRIYRGRWPRPGLPLAFVR